MNVYDYAGAKLGEADVVLRVGDEAVLHLDVLSPSGSDARPTPLDLDPLDPPRPLTRGDCEAGPRPCPWASCHHHLYLDITKTGRLKINFPALEIDELRETCALDVAAQGGLHLEEVGVLIGVTRERIRQIEADALAKLEALPNGMSLRDFWDDAADAPANEEP